MKAMDSCKRLSVDILDSFPKADVQEVDRLLGLELDRLNKKLVVLDDDPTGVQTVHGVSVYTDWSKNSFEDGFQSGSNLFFILTNSRSFTTQQTEQVHQEIASNLSDVSVRTEKDFILMSRSDSTLRGHYPLETTILKEEIEKRMGYKFDGEIIFPFFQEGGRYTIGNIHYVKEGDSLVPCAQTEFARDKSFGYTESDLTRWCEEKTKGAYKAEDVTCITLDSLRGLAIDSIVDQLMAVEAFNKIIVNAVDYIDVKIFCIAFIRAVLKGKRFMFRCAAAVTKVLGGIPDKPLLTNKDLVDRSNPNGGILLVGSHVHKTSQQLEELKNSKYPIEFIEFNQHLVKEDDGLANEVIRVVAAAEASITTGKTVAIYTRRERFDLDTDDKDAQLLVSVQISDAVTSIIEKLCAKPSFIIAKGGITSSDVGVKALKVKKAVVMGQIKPGIPVWKTGHESKFPGMPFIIFPGNVGEVSTLREIVEELLATTG